MPEAMTTNEMLMRLREARDVFDARLADVMPECFDVPPEGFTHSPKEVVAHISAYDILIVERLREARQGRTTAFDRDREGWEAFNERVWAEAAAMEETDVRARAMYAFGDLLAEVAGLTDDELNEATGTTQHIDPAWLDDNTLAKMIAIDSYEHYPMHLDLLKAAAKAGG